MLFIDQNKYFLRIIESVLTYAPQDSGLKLYYYNIRAQHVWVQYIIQYMDTNNHYNVHNTLLFQFIIVFYYALYD